MDGTGPQHDAQQLCKMIGDPAENHRFGDRDHGPAYTTGIQRAETMNLTVGKKLGLGFGTILVVMVFSSVVSYLKARTIREVEARVGIHVSSQKALFELQRDVNRAQSKGREVILLGSQPPVTKARDQFSSNLIKILRRSTSWPLNGLFKRTATGWPKPKVSSQALESPGVRDESCKRRVRRQYREIGV